MKVLALQRGWLFDKLANRLVAVAHKRPPDFVIGGIDRPYLRRWWLTPWKRWTERLRHHQSPLMRGVGRVVELLPNAYLHQFLRSDDDRALHSHPWLFNLSVLLFGPYREHTSETTYEDRKPGDWKFRWGAAWHRIELFRAGFAVGNGPTRAIGREIPCWTLFITGPNVREWGFDCAGRFVHWKIFTSASDKGAIGRGCD